MSIFPKWQSGGGRFVPSHGYSRDPRDNSGSYGPDNGHAALMENLGIGQAPTGKQVKEVQMMIPFFGEPQKDRVFNMQRWNTYEKENSDYGEAFTQMYSGPGGTFTENGHLSRVLLEKTLAVHQWQLTLMAPWQYHPNSLDFRWDIIKFNRTMLDKVPERALPRMMTQTSTSGSATMVRYGICFAMEVTFLGTPKGRWTYRMTIEQIKEATVETCSLGAMVAVLEHEPYRPVDGPSNGSEFTMNDLNQHFRTQKEQWGMVHKSHAGAKLAMSKLRMELESRGVSEGNLFILPKGMATHLDHARMNDAQYTFMTGPRASSDDAIRRALLSTSGATVVESRDFLPSTHSKGFDPFFRPVGIGGYTTMYDDLVRDCSPGEYKTSMLDIWVYGGEFLDNYVKLHYTDMYQFAGAWDFRSSNAPLTDTIGRGYMHDMGCYTWGQLLHKNGSMQRTLEHLKALSPDKRGMFVASLRRFKDPNHACVKLPKGALFPGQHYDTPQFDPKEFDSQEKMQDAFTIPELLNFKRRTGEGTLGLTPAASARVDAGRFKRRPDDFPRPTSLRKEFEDGAPLSDVDSSDDDDDVTMFHESNGAIIRTQAARTTVRIKRPVFGPRGKDTAERMLATEVYKLVNKLLALSEHCSEAPAEIEAAKKHIQKWTDRLTNGLPSVSDKVKRALLEQLFTVLDGQITIAKTRAPKVAITAAVLEVMIVCYFVPFLARYQARFVAANVQHSRTQLEAKIQADPTLDLELVDEKYTEQGWWDPNTNNSDPAAAARNTFSTEVDAWVPTANHADANAAMKLLVETFHNAVNARVIAALAPPSVSRRNPAPSSVPPSAPPSAPPDATASSSSSAAATSGRASSGPGGRNRPVKAVSPNAVSMFPDDADDLFNFENGSVRVALHYYMSRQVPTPSLSLPLDALAASLTATHAVLFELTKNQYTQLVNRSLVPLLAKKMHTDRLDAFIWSITLSAIHHAISYSGGDASHNTAGVIKTLASMAPANTARIQRVSVGRQANNSQVLPSQMGSKEYIHKLEDVLKAWVSEDYKNIHQVLSDALWSVKLERDAVLEAANTIQNGYQPVQAPASVAAAAPIDVLLQRNALQKTFNITPTDVEDDGKYHGGNKDIKRRVQIAFQLLTNMSNVKMPASRFMRELTKSPLIMDNLFKEALGLDIDLTNDDQGRNLYYDETSQLMETFVEIEKATKYAANARSAGSGDIEAVQDANADIPWTEEHIEQLLSIASLHSGLFYQFCVEYDIPVPFYLRMWQPNQSYMMAPILYMHAGPNGAAQTYHHKPHFMLAPNASQKMILGHYTLWTKTIIRDKDRIAMLHNVFCNRYIGGHDVEVWDPLSVAHKNEFATNKLARSIFVTLGFMSMANAHHTTFRSFTGQMPVALPVTRDVREMLRYEGCSAVSKFWNYNTSACKYNLSNQFVCTSERHNSGAGDSSLNVICHQGYQANYSPTTKQYTVHTLNAGYWGQDAQAPGNAAVISGERIVFDPPSYSTTNRESILNRRG